MSEQDPLRAQTRPERRLFLERRGYTQKRTIDAARLLPVLGLVLFMVPLIWPKADESVVVETSASTFYIFAVWFVLILVGGFLATRIGAISEPNEQSGGGDPVLSDLDLHVDGSE